MKQAFTVWLTGLSGAGKSTLGQAIVNFLKERQQPVQLLDGDIVRNEIGHLFGYSKEERMKMSKVIRFTSKMLNQNGTIVVVAAIAPYQEMREANRKEMPDYLEIFVNCPLAECIKRDTKGMYKKAIQGEMKNVVGIDDVYEIPQSHDLEVNTSLETIDQSMEKIAVLLEARLGS
ncbi:adenylyl-sulfate kinase [Paenibacillus hexagrammi]|uniref:Adenylyl-sulfate kinase n=1 Tax=Paenibacillus hexagrammi TaxID=2908839 RepID=A0ABY3SH70_9BACL|nr:adenylyl-sulfate kinase [Paenibacillus sp. YPD9-1]UJF33212.1 adenylyl-sulfate kinase [Paenibacillus sp. YPD9-1]